MSEQPHPTPRSDATFVECFGCEEADWTPNQKKAARLARDLERELAQAKEERDLAVMELQEAGWTHVPGAERWKPPVNHKVGALWKRVFVAEDQLSHANAMLEKARTALANVIQECENVREAEGYPSVQSTTTIAARSVLAELEGREGK